MSKRRHPDPHPRDDTDVARDVARDLAEIASHIGHLKGDANAFLTDPNYSTLLLRLENAHAAVEAAAVEARRRARIKEEDARHPAATRTSLAGLTIPYGADDHNLPLGEPAPLTIS